MHMQYFREMKEVTDEWLIKFHWVGWARYTRLKIGSDCSVDAAERAKLIVYFDSVQRRASDYHLWRWTKSYIDGCSFASLARSKRSQSVGQNESATAISNRTHAWLAWWRHSGQ